MIDLTPLEVRKKKGDFRRMMRGYDPALVDDFLDMVADRMELLVRQNLSLNERLSVLEAQVSDFKDRERALTEALVTAQEMRTEIREQVQKEADIARREAESQAETIRVSALTARQKEEEAIRRLRARQMQLLGSYRSFLERELAELTVMAETLEVQRSRPVFMDEPLPGDEDLDVSLEATHPVPAAARPVAPAPAAKAPAAKPSGVASKSPAAAAKTPPATNAPAPAASAPAPAAKPPAPSASAPAPARMQPETSTSVKPPAPPRAAQKEPENDSAPSETAWVSTLIERKL